MSITAIVFDLDGTLVDSYPAIQESLNRTLSHFGLPPVHSQKIRRMVGRGLENLMRQAVGEMHLQEGIQLFRESYDQTVLKGTFLMPEVAVTLRKLQDAGIKMGVASNKPEDYSRMILRHLQIRPFFVSCLGPDGNIPPKPDRTMVHVLLKNLGSSPEKSLYVGDMALDVQTARNAGVRVALIPGGGDDVETLAEAFPDFLLTAFSDLLSLVR